MFSIPYKAAKVGPSAGGAPGGFTGRIPSRSTSKSIHQQSLMCSRRMCTTSRGRWPVHRIIFSADLTARSQHLRIDPRQDPRLPTRDVVCAKACLTRPAASGVWPDTAYRLAANETFPIKNGFVSHMHRKKPNGRAMPEMTRRANNAKSRIHSGIELYSPARGSARWSPISQASSPGRCCCPLCLVRCGGPSAVRVRTAANRALRFPFVPVRQLTVRHLASASMSSGRNR